MAVREALTETRSTPDVLQVTSQLFLSKSAKYVPEGDDSRMICRSIAESCVLCNVLEDFDVNIIHSTYLLFDACRYCYHVHVILDVVLEASLHVLKRFSQV